MGLSYQGTLHGSITKQRTPAALQEPPGPWPWGVQKIPCFFFVAPENDRFGEGEIFFEDHPSFEDDRQPFQYL